MKRITFVFVFFWAAFFASLCVAQQTQQTKPSVKKIDEKADQLMHKMNDTLANMKSFTLRTKEIHDKMRSSGKKVQAKVSREVAVQRPDKIWMHVVSQAPDRSRDLGIWYDGKTLIFQSDKEKVFARTKMPPTIDEALDYIGDTINVPTPMADIFYSSPYDSFISEDTTGGYVKLEKIESTSCHQLAFKNSIVDWRIWIADAERAVPCQLEITYKLDYGAPKISMTFLDWKFEPQISENQFAHEPPADYQKIKIIGRVPMEEPADKSPQTQENEP